LRHQIPSGTDDSGFDFGAEFRVIVPLRCEADEDPEIALPGDPVGYLRPDPMGATGRRSTHWLVG